MVRNKQNDEETVFMPVSRSFEAIKTEWSIFLFI